MTKLPCLGPPGVSDDGPARWLALSDEVRAALSERRAVVALESTVIAHGLPAPVNLEVALAMEAAVRDAGAVPATVGVCKGRVTIGMSEADIERFAARTGVAKASARDVPRLAAAGADGATTVAGTLLCAHAAGVEVMATGGIGGVHRGHERSGDVSADLEALARYPVAVVASGAKSILDLPRTLEHLEAAGVAVVGYGTNDFPAFYCRGSGLDLDARVDGVEEAARLVASHREIGVGLLIANPISAACALGADEMESLVQAAVRAAARDGVDGKAVTPFLLEHIARASEGRTLQANRDLLIANAALAGQIALQLVGLPRA